MTEHLFERVSGYCESMALVRVLQENEMIDPAEVAILERMIADKYRFGDRSIYREMT